LWNEGTKLERLIEDIYRSQSRRILATLIRLLGNFDRAEEALQEAFATAARTWPRDGVPANPFSWLVSTGRFRAIDALRRRHQFDASLEDIASSLYPEADTPEGTDMEAIEDDILRLIFICCHPTLSVDGEVALALREVCGLTTEEIAHAFLVPAPTVAQRIVRAKNRIRQEHIPYEIPEPAELPSRLERVLRVIYLVFNEGYSASAGNAVVRADLASEAIRLCRLLCALLPHREAKGLLALMLLQDSRRRARADAAGNLILLADQDRTLWDGAKIAEGLALIADALRGPLVGSYVLQAAIAAEHARAREPGDTNWHRIAGLYELLLADQPSPVVELNRAVAIAMCDGPKAGLSIIDDLFGRGELTRYHLAHAARADFLRQMKHMPEARQAYRTALELCRQAPEQAFLRKRLADLESGQTQ
jgi:RNA polymerase sigma-70 factor (ECF subfamily)